MIGQAVPCRIGPLLLIPLPKGGKMFLFKPDSLVLYKNRPARLLRMGDRLEIELEGGETARVRPKDILFLHPGPLGSMKELTPQQGDIRTAWEILAGGRTTLEELAELAYGVFTPAAAWSAWQHIASQLYFSGIPEDIRAHTAEEVEQKQKERAQAEALPFGFAHIDAA